MPPARRLDSSGLSGVAERTSRLGYARQLAERSFDIVTPIVLATATFVVHPLGTVLRQPFWLDEAWVASVARAPLRQWLDLSSSSPLGWQFLVRLLTFGHGESARLVTLAFAAGAVAVAYLAVRQLPWPSRISARAAALATSVTVLVAPVSLFRNDLKQYTADTFVAILLVMLAWRAEAQRSRRALIVFAVATVVVLPFSSIAPFVALPLFGGLLAGAFIAGSRKSAIETLTIGAVALGADALYFAVVVLPHDNSALRAFWRSRYLSGSSLHVVNTASHSFHALSPLFGMPSLLLGLLVIAGCATLVCLRRPAVAIAIALLWIEMFILGIARRYPFLDARTSTFLVETSLLVATVGFAGVVIAAARASRVLAVVIVVGATLGYGHSVAPDIRCRSIPFEDARTMTDYVSTSSRPGDTIVVSFGASYSFAYYLPHARVQYVPTKAQANGFLARVVVPPGIVYEPERRSAVDINQTLRIALTQATAPHATGRILVLLAHVYPEQEAGWLHSLSSLGLRSDWVDTGSQPVLVVANARQPRRPNAPEPDPVALAPRSECGAIAG